MTEDTQALARGLTVLELLAVNGPLTLARLHELSKLPKSTLRRILLTLVERNFVRRSLSDDRYRLVVTLPIISPEPQSPGAARLISAVFPNALRLTRQINWPSDIHLREHHWMRIVDSTRSASSARVFQGHSDRRVHLFGSASGIACLSTLNLGEVFDLFNDPDLGKAWSPDRIDLSWKDYERILIETRARGYGTRQGVYLGETSLDDKLAAIAVPLMRRGQALGALTVLYPRGLMPEAEFAEAYLAPLVEAARDCEAALAERVNDFETVAFGL